MTLNTASVHFNIESYGLIHEIIEIAFILPCVYIEDLVKIEWFVKVFILLRKNVLDCVCLHWVRFSINSYVIPLNAGDLGFYFDFYFLSASNESVISEGIIWLEIKFTVYAMKFGWGVFWVVKIFVEAVEMDIFPDAGSDFSEALVEVNEDQFVFFASMALIC